MKIFVAGGTGVLGRASLGPLIANGHSVRSTARGPEKTKLVRDLGAEPVDIDLYNLADVRQVMAGSDAVIRLTTKIGSLAKFREKHAWDETNRLRVEGARILVDAAQAERVPVYIHESVTFVYQDGGENWLGEDSAVDDGGSKILRATLEGEQEAARFSQSGGRGIVLRFAGFYGAECPSTSEMATMARRRMLAQLGPATNYFSSVHIADAGRAVASAVSLTAGTYNVCDDEPVRFQEYLRIFTAALGLPKPYRLPGMFGKWMFGEVWNYFSRSQRVSNAKLKEHSGWRPQVKSVAEGWPLVAAG